MAAMDQPAVDLREPAGWRRTKNRIATTLMVLAFVIVLIPLGFVLYTVIAKGASTISWSFLTGSPIPPNVVPVGIGGMWAAIYGTLVITRLAAVITVPLRVLGAIYLNENSSPRGLAPARRGVSHVIDRGPPILVGLFF